MRQWNKAARKAVLAVVALLLAAGCSSSPSAGGSTERERVQLTMQAWGNPAELKVYQKALDAFTKENPQIQVKLVPVPGDQYEQKLLTSLQGNRGPDVFYASEPTMARLIAAGQVQPLSEFLQSEESYVQADEFPEGLWGPARKDGEIYGLPPDANPLVIYYNKKVFQGAGVKSPQEYYDEGRWNWEAFREVTGQLKEAGKQGYIMENWWAHWYSWVWSNGGRIFDEQGKLVLSENEPAKEAFAFMHDLVQDGNAVYAGSLPKGQGADAMFMSGQVGMLAAGRWLEPLFTQNKNIEFDYIAFPSNTGKKEPVAVPGAYFAVNSKNPHVEEAMKFVSFYVSRQGQEIRLADGGNALAAIPAADEAIMSKSTIEHTRYFSEARDGGYSHGSNMAYDAQIPGLNPDITEIIDLMFLGKQDARTTVTRVTETIAAALK
ncbi:ABC transporter substrate-binding protein [Paenibacillus medicaginis]|uniref:ABC transporter substrate-binding protein n=1 Tax=Paenibacillus medicaginis TaxID=1470560 RepID=A0ABV5C4X2_9BACL